MEGIVLETHAVRVERVAVAPGTSLKNHSHPVPHLCFLERGRVSQIDGGRVTVVEEGTLRSSPSGDEINLEVEEPTRFLLILLEGSIGEFARTTDRRHRKFFRSERTARLAGGVIKNLESPDPSPLANEAAILELLASLEREERGLSTTSPPAWLKRVRERIREEVDPPSTRVMANECGYHPVYVARAFRQHFGIGLGDYGRLIRAERAIELLGADLPLAEVALAAGYSDQSHLTRSIQRYTGLTPRQVRSRRGSLVKVASIQDTRRAGS